MALRYTGVKSKNNPFIVGGSPQEPPVQGPGGGSGGDNGGGGDTPKYTDIFIGTTVAVEQDLRMWVDSEPELSDSDGGTPSTDPSWDLLGVRIEVSGVSSHGLTETEDSSNIYLRGFYNPGIFGGMSIDYLDDDYNLHTVYDWADLPPKDSAEFYTITQYNAPTRGSVNLQISVILTVGSSNYPPSAPTQEFTTVLTQFVANDWTGGKNKLKEYKQ